MDARKEPGGLTKAWRHALAVPLVAWGIVGVSVLSGAATWRASSWSAKSDRYERLATQDVAFRHQLRADVRANVDEDMRLFGAFEQHWDRAVRLQAQAERERDPVLVARLTRHAQREYTTADVPLSRMVADPGYDRDDLATFDALAAIRDREEEMPELAGVRVSRNEQLAADAKDKATHLLGIAFVLAASLFFLTLAQLTRQVAARIFGIAGASIGAVAVVLFIVV